jgi:hypothetical protein
MASLELGQRIEIDLFGMRVPGLRGSDLQATGVVVGLAPGTITVRLESPATIPEISISPGRVLLD